MNTPGKVTSALVDGWKHSLSTIGHAVCVHYQCRLCFLSLSGIVSHHRTCRGWTSPNDYLPCLHCGARFKQFKSCQTHSLRNHQHLFGSDDESDIKSEVVSPPRIPSPHVSPRPLPIPPAPDVVPRPSTIRARRPDGSVAILTPASRPSSIGGRSSSTVYSGRVLVYREDSNFPQSSSSRNVMPYPTVPSPIEEVVLEDNEATSSSQGHISQRENVLVEKELRLTQLETLVKQAEMKAEQAKKTKELAEWEKDLQRREREAKRRLADAERILRENSISVENERRHQVNVDCDDASPAASADISSQPLSSTRGLDLSPPDTGESTDSSVSLSRQCISPSFRPSFVYNPPPTTTSTSLFPTPLYRHYNPGPAYTSTPLLRLPTTIPIVLPSTARLPPSAIRLAPSPHPQGFPPPSTPSRSKVQDSPINLSKSKFDQSSSLSKVPASPLTLESSSIETQASPPGAIRLVSPLPSHSTPSPPPLRSCKAGSPVLRAALTAPQSIKVGSSSTPLQMMTSPGASHSSPLSTATHHSSIISTITTTVITSSESSESSLVPLASTCPASLGTSSVVTAESTQVVASGSSSLVVSKPSSSLTSTVSLEPSSLCLEPTSVESLVASSIASTPEPSSLLSLPIALESVSSSLASATTGLYPEPSSQASIPTSDVSCFLPEVPCVEISKETVMEMQVGVVDDGNLDSGANISFPFSDSAVETNFLLSDTLVLDQLLNSSGGKIVNLVATEGPDGSMTLSATSVGEAGDTNDEHSTEVEGMENELEKIKKSMHDIRNQVDSDMNNSDKIVGQEGAEEESSPMGDGPDQVLSPIKLNKSKAAMAALTNNMEEDSLESIERQIEEHTKVSGGDLVNYFEMRLKEFETEIAQESCKESSRNEIVVADEMNIATASEIVNSVSENVDTSTLHEEVETFTMSERNDKAEKPKNQKCDNVTDQEIDSANVTADSSNNAKDNEIKTGKVKKKRKRDCPGTSWFGCSNFRSKAKKRKIEEKKAEGKEEVPEKTSKSLNAQLNLTSPSQRKSTRLKSNNKSVSTPPCSRSDLQLSSPVERTTSTSPCTRSVSTLSSPAQRTESTTCTRSALQLSSPAHRRSERIQSSPKQTVSVRSVRVQLSKLPTTSKASSSPSCSQRFMCGKCSLIFKTERERQRHRTEVHGAGDHVCLPEEKGRHENSMHSETLHSEQESAPLNNKRQDDKKESSKDENALEGIVNIESSRYGSKVPRKAAAKAQGRVAEFVKQMTTKFEYESSEAEGDVSDGSDDNYDVKNEAEVFALYKIANDGKSRQCFKCNVCEEKFSSKDEVESHVVTEHQEEILADEDDDEDLDDLESSDYEEESDDDCDDEKRRYKKRSKTPLLGHRRLHLEPWPYMVSMEHSFRSRFFHLNDFLCFSANLTSWVAENRDTSFFPGSNISSRFTVNNITSKEEEEVKILSRFSGGLVNNSPIMFCGGPITAMAWCPSNNEEQVLAVVSKLDFDATKQGEEGGGKGLIQFWRMGKLGMEGNGEAPVLQFSVGHQYGCVREVEWCPSLGRDLGRLGLIGAACGDGSVRVWTIPSLDTVQEEGLMYVREADMSLVCGEKVGQCLTLSWYKGPGHNYIAASFSSGMVCIWYLATMSSLLKNGNTLLPVQSWLAHTGSVTGLSLCPGEEERPKYLITGGSDRCYRFWDLTNLAVPLQEVKRGLVSGVKWIPGWNGGSVTYDDVYLQGHTQSIIAETGYYSTKPSPVLAQNSSVLDQDMSHWVGTIAIVTAAGELVVFAVPPLDRNLEHDKNLGQRRTYVYRTEVAKDTKEQMDLRKYEDMKEISMIRFIDMPITKSTMDISTIKDMVRVRVAERMDVEDLTCFPLASITKVAWNNNLGSQFWLVSGGQSGLVRAHCVQVLNTVRMKEALKEVMTGDKT